MSADKRSANNCRRVAGEAEREGPTLVHDFRVALVVCLPVSIKLKASVFVTPAVRGCRTSGDFVCGAQSAAALICR